MSTTDEKTTKELLFYYRFWQRKPTFIDNKQTDNNEGIEGFQGNTSQDNASSEDFFDFMKLKLKPDLKIKAEINLEIENIQNHELNASQSKNILKQKKAALIKKWQHILTAFSHHLRKIGKAHLIRDCVLDCSGATGKILFLSSEVLSEFLQFKPDIKHRLRTPVQVPNASHRKNKI